MQRQQARSGSPYEETMGFSRAVRYGSTVSVSGTAPIWPDGHVDHDPAVQARRCWEIVFAALDELGASAQDVVRTRMYVVSADVAGAVGACTARCSPTFVRPARWWSSPACSTHAGWSRSRPTPW